MTPEDIREFEKAPKSLVKMKGTEVLFEDDAVGKMRYIYAAFEDDEALRKVCEEVLSSEEGGKHLVRALNNIKTIPHMPAMRFARAVYETVLPQWDLLTRVQKCQQLLDNIGESFEGDDAWLDQELLALLDELRDDASAYTILWSAWLGANMRSAADSDKILRKQAPKRLPTLSKPVFNQLVRTMDDEEEAWEYRAAAMYALVGARALRIDQAQKFIEYAYTNFPLESLSGIEALSMALEFDAANYAESDAISEKLAQVRHDHLILREMNKDAFVQAAERLFKRQNELPKEALEIALSLASLDKNDRMLATILIDDARRNDFIQIALKTQTLRGLAGVFFSNFVADNPLCRTLSISIVSALTENSSADALMAENWFDACEAGDADSLRAQSKNWIF